MTTKTALVTGGTGGIGGAAAAALAGDGYEVVATGLTDAEIAAAPARVGIRYARLDVTDDAAVTRLVSEFEGLDALVNAAGIIQRGGREFDIEGFRTTLEVNLVGTMRMCMAALPALRRRRGGVLNIGSMFSFFGAPVTPGYAASKGGIAQLTKSLAAAWAAEGVRVNAVAPGYIATDLTQALQADGERSRRIVERTPMGRWGAPDDVGAVIRFLLSPEAGFVTGVVMPVDGGYLIS